MSDNITPTLNFNTCYGHDDYQDYLDALGEAQGEHNDLAKERLAELPGNDAAAKRHRGGEHNDCACDRQEKASVETGEQDDSGGAGLAGPSGSNRAAQRPKLDTLSLIVARTEKCGEQCISAETQIGAVLPVSSERPTKRPRGRRAGASGSSGRKRARAWLVTTLEGEETSHPRWTGARRREGWQEERRWLGGYVSVVGNVWRALFPRTRAVRMKLADFMERLGAAYQFMGWEQERSSIPGVIQALARRRGGKVPECAHTWKTPTCLECGNEVHAFSFPLDGCDAPVCPVCARRRSKKRRQKLDEYVKAHMPRKGLGYYLITATIPVREYVNAMALREDTERLHAGVKNIWDMVLKYKCSGVRGKSGGGRTKWLAPVPRADGSYELPGERLPVARRELCKEAGFVRFDEFGVSCNIHAHCLFYGEYHRAELIRAAFQQVCPDATQINVKWVEGGRKGIQKAVREVAKYVVKGSLVAGELAEEFDSSEAPDYSSQREGEFVDPFFAALYELATASPTSGRACRRIESYGSMRYVFGDHSEDEDEDGESDGDSPPECPVCGSSNFVWREKYRPFAWVPRGWSGVSKGTGPPAQAPPRVLQ